MKEWVYTHSFVLLLKNTRKGMFMAKEIIKTAYSIGDAVARAQGVDLIHAEYKKEAGEWYLRLYIDRPGGVGIDQCEAFSRAFGEELDKIDPIAEPYCLEVSSPGVERQLKTDREFSYYIGRQVAVKLYQAVNGKKEFHGILAGYQDGKALIQDGGDALWVDPKGAVYIRLYFTF